MFSDSETAVWEFLPQRLLTSGHLTENSSQTDLVLHSTKETQVKHSTDVEIQHQENIKITPEINYDHLLEFLVTAEQMCNTELSLAEQEYSIFAQFLVNEEPNESDSKILSSLQTRLKDGDILDMDFNCNGVAIGICYGKSLHESWCNHENGYTAVWFILRSEVNPSEPHYTIPSNGCPTSVKFHSSDPCLLAICSYFGKISLWSIARQDQYLLCEVKCNSADGNDDAIACSLWSKDVFIAAGMDGRISFWDFDIKMKSLKEAKSTHLRLKHLGFIKDPLAYEMPLGITCIDFDPNDNAVMIGTNLGFVLLVKGESITVIGKHQSYVLNTGFLDSSQNTGYSAAQDSFIFIYSKQEKLYSFFAGENLVSAAVLNTKPSRICTLDSRGRYKIWDVQNSRAQMLRDIAVLESDERQDKKKPAKFVLNQRNVNYTAVGLHGGKTDLVLFGNNRRMKYRL